MADSRSISLKWDGTCLGEWSSVTSVKVDTHQHRIEYLGRTLMVSVFMTNTPYMCLVDELKPFFGLVKVGTHWFKRGSRSVVICNGKYYASASLITFIKDGGLKDDALKIQYPVLFGSLQEIFVYRYIMGVNRTTRGDIKVHEFVIKTRSTDEISKRLEQSEDKFYGVSIAEREPAEADSSPELSREIVCSYFSKISMGYIAQNMCRVRTYRQLDRFLISMATHVDDTVRRIDRKLITVSNGINQRSMTLLTSMMKEETVGVRGPPPRVASKNNCDE